MHQFFKFWVQCVFVFFIALCPINSFGESIHFHHFYRSEMTGSPIYLSGKLSDANWSDAKRLPSFHSQRAQLDPDEQLLVVKHPHPHSHNQKTLLQPVRRLKLYFKSFLPDRVACHLSRPSDIRLRTDPEKPYELHILQGSINSGCSQLLSDTETIPFAPVDDRKYTFYPDDLWLIEFPPLEPFHQKPGNDNFGMPGISDSKDSRELLSGYYGGDSGFKFDFKPGGGGGSNLIDISVAFSIAPKARQKGGGDQPVLVLESQEGVSIEVTDAQGNQWQKFYTMDEAGELLEGVEDGDELLSRLRRASLSVKAVIVDDLPSVCRESMKRIVQLEVRRQLLSGSGEIDQQSGDADKCSVSGVISCNDDKNKKSGGSSGQQPSDQQNSSGQSSRVSSSGNTLGGGSTGGATGGDDERDDDEKPREKIKLQCETENCLLIAQQDEEMAEPGVRFTKKRKQELEETMSQLSLSNSCASCTELAPRLKAMRLGPRDIEELKEQLVDDTFDVFSLDKNDSLDSIIQYCFNRYPKAHISLVQHPTEMYEGDLINRVIVHSSEDSMSEATIALRSIENVQPGALYSSEPRIILVDFRRMSPASISELNELLETPARFRGQLLGTGVKVIALVSEDMEPEVDQNNSHRPGQDFWRRINRPANTWTIMNTEPVKPLRLIIKEYSENHMDDVNQEVTLDFFGESDWHKLLYGTYTLNDTGQAQYCHSALKKLSGTPALVILRAAPWGDPAFELALRQMLFRKSYEANGEIIDLSSTAFVRQPADRGADRALLDSITITSSAPNAFMINDKNLEACLGTTAIIDGSPQRHDVLGAIIQQYSSLRISSALTIQQWRKLLRKIQSFQYTSPVSVVIDDPAQHPPGFSSLKDEPAPIPDSHHVNVIRTNSEEYSVRKLKQELSNWLRGQTLYELALTPELEASQISIGVQVRSFNQRQFEVMTSGLITAMRRGQPVLLRNLHKNALLQKQLETLLQYPPGLVAGGQLLRFPKASVTVLLPENDRLASSAWQEHKHFKLIVTPEIIKQQLTADFSLNETELLDLQKLEKLLTHMQSIPRSPGKEWPFPAPTFGIEVGEKVIRQARLEQNLQGVDNLRPEHWRRAINTVVLKEYRGAPEIHAYLKQICSALFDSPLYSPSGWVDRDSLVQILNDNPVLDRSWVREHYWQLLRAFFPSLFPHLPLNFSDRDDQTIDYLCRALLSISPDNRQDNLAESLGVKEPAELPPLNRNRHIEKLIREAALVDHGQSGAPVPDEMNVFSSSLQIASALNTPEDQRFEGIMKALTGLNINSQDLQKQLAIELADDRRNWHLWQEKHFLSLEQKVREHKILFLKGAAGAGKTFTAQVVAARLNPDIPAVTATIGPQASQESLLQRQVVQAAPVVFDGSILERVGFSDNEIKTIEQYVHSKEGFRYLTLTDETKFQLQQELPHRYEQVLNHFTDTCTTIEEGSLVRWARLRPKAGSTNPIVLILDEANLADPELWSLLKGMTSSPPVLNHGGDIIELTPQHRIIFTGNPETAPGRRTSSSLRDALVTSYYQPLSDSFLEECVITPRLKKIEGISTHYGACVKTILELWSQFRRLLPEREFTPRDLNEICDRLGVFSVVCQWQLADDDLNALVWQAMADTLGGELDPDRDQLESLRTWYQAHHQDHLDQGMMSTTQAQFEKFYLSLKEGQATKDNFSFDGQSVRDLTKKIWLTLQKISVMTEGQALGLGKRATLIEGPSGRGKDELLRRVLFRASQTPELKIDADPIHLNAGRSGWEKVRATIQKAQREGRIIILSELNLLPSQYLEGELNDVLSGEGNVHPGFHLFATINPPSFSGREELSPALKSRFVRYRITDYSPEELAAIAARMLPDSPEQAQLYADCHCRLRSLMKARQLPLEPSTSDLKNLLHWLRQIPNLPPEQADYLFCAQYRLLLKQAGITLNDLKQGGSVPAGTLQTGNQEPFSRLQQALLRQIYTTFPNLNPVTLVYGSQSTFDPAAGTLFVNSRRQLAPHSLTSLNPVVEKNTVLFQEACREIINGLWKESGLPEKYPWANDHLPSALFWCWKRQFAQSFIDDTALVNQIFPMSPVLEDTLSRSENRPYIDKANQLLTSLHYQPSPVMYRQMRELMQLPAATVQGELSKPVAGAMETEPQKDAGMEVESQKGTGMEPTPQNEPVEVASKTPEVNPGAAISVPQLVRGIRLASKALVGKCGEEYSLSHSSKGTGRNVIVDRVFKDFSHKQNRFGIVMLDIDEKGEPKLLANPFGRYGFNSIPWFRLDVNTPLTQAQTLGQQSIFLGDKKWHALCGLKDFPQGRLIFIMTEPELPSLEIVHDRGTGLYLVRADQATVGAYTVNFVIEERGGSKMPQHETIIRIPCPEPLARLVEEHDSIMLVRLRQELRANTNPMVQVNHIKQFCNSFKSTDDLTAISGLPLIRELLSVRPASSFHRSLAFTVLTGWCGIPSRMVEGALNQITCEVSEDGGASWRPLELGGFVENPSKAIEKKPDFPKVPKEDLGMKRGLIDWSYGFEKGNPVTPEKVRHLLDTITPGSDNYHQLTLIFHHTVAATISTAGPVSVDRVKEWLDERFRHEGRDSARESKEVARDLLVDLQKNIGKDGASPDLKEIHSQLSSYILVEKQWLAMDVAADGVNSLSRNLQEVVSSTKKKYYQGCLTRELIRDKDIKLVLEPDESKALDSEVKLVVSKLLKEVSSPKLINALYGELPGEVFKEAPPGSVAASRLVQRLPPFKRTLPQPSRLPAMLVAPTLEYAKSAYKRLKKEARNPQMPDNKSHCSFFQKNKSELLANFIAPYIRRSFLDYVYRVAGGEEGSLLVLFPSARKTGFLETEMQPNIPEQAGWIKPESEDEMYELASVWSGCFVPNNDHLLQEAWVKQGFNESGLRLLNKSLMEKLLADYMDQIDWPSLIARLDNIPQWQEHIEKTEAKLQKDAEGDHQRAQKRIERARENGEEPREIDLEILEEGVGIIDDLI